MKKVIVLGYGISGKSCARFLLTQQLDVVCVDEKQTLAEDSRISIIKDLTKEDLQNCLYVIKSPGISFYHRWILLAEECGVKVLLESEAALSFISKTDKKVIGITGSNGKTTTTLFTTHLLQEYGKTAIAIGNCGIGLFDFTHIKEEILVAEISSFQLEHINEGEFFDSACILNISETHMDRYNKYSDYIIDKFSILKCLKQNANLYIPKFVRDEFEEYIFNKEKILEIDYLFNDVKELVALDNVKYKWYLHDVYNITMAVFLIKDIVGYDKNVLQKSIKTFVKPDHRLQFVREVNGVTYINDSKSTSIDAIKKAIEAIDGNIILIVGGVDKGGSFKSLESTFNNKVSSILAIGPAADRIQQELESNFYVEKQETLQKAVEKASEIAKEGDFVILSPGCSSFDAFSSYTERGKTYVNCVFGLGEKCYES